MALSQIVGDPAAPEALRRHVAGALNYLFKSLDLIPDGIEDLGFIDDAFVLRAVGKVASTVEGAPKVVTELAADAELVQEFLGADYARLERFVNGLGEGSARGRSVESIVTDPSVAASLVSDVKGWASSYVVPSFARDPKNLVKLRSFLQRKLPG
jgi:uncharacterized membrane protein YkvA (DUF1232 family)